MFRRNSAAILAVGAAATLVLAGAVPASAGSASRTPSENNEPVLFSPGSMGAQASGKFIALLKAPAAAEMSGVSKTAAADAVAKSQASAIAAAKSLGASVDQRYGQVVNGFAFTATNRVASQLAKNGAFASISATQQYVPDNAVSNVHTGAAGAWVDNGLTGKGVKVAIIDSGIDYCHTDFGGAGSDCYTANPDNTVIEAGSFPTAKVIAGYDLVGDAYNAGGTGAAKVPHPDADPMDCNEHGSHVAGTAAGYGVNADGSTYKGAYTAAATTGLKIGPGSAPEASLLAFRVFGCSGSVDTSVVIDAINRSVAAGAQVINMSLGSSFGIADGGYNATITAAVKAGTVVVASAGNSGPGAYITGSPGSTKAALSVAAINNATIPGTVATLSDNSTVDLQNGGTLAAVASGTFAVANFLDATKRQGCNPSDLADGDGNSLVAGKIAVIQRGTCAFSQKQAVAAYMGATMLIIIQNSTNGANFIGGMAGLTNAIPVFSAQYKLTSSATTSTLSSWYYRDGLSATFADGQIANVSANAPASFSSSGPRSGDGGFKPDVAAPGVSIRSALSGSGNGYADFSGTSMASPHTAGTVALVRQAHPAWNAFQVKAAMVNTATKDSSKITGSTNLIGNGLVQPASAATNGLLVYPAAIAADGDTSLSFGLREEKSITMSRQIAVDNQTGADQTVTLSSSLQGSPAGASISFSTNNFTVRAGRKQVVNVTLTLSSTFMANRPAVDQWAQTAGLPSAVNALYGQVIATAGSKVSTVPLVTVAFGRAAISNRVSGGVLTSTNNGNNYGSVEVYDWALAGKKDTTGTVGVNIRSVGAESWAAGGKQYVQFALDTFNGVYNWGSVYSEIGVDTNNDGYADFGVTSFDYGYLTTGYFSGQVGTYAYNYNTNKASGVYKTPVALNSSLISPYVKASDLGLTGAAGKDSYSIVYAYTSPWNGADDYIENVNSGTIKPWAPLRSNGDWLDVDPGTSASTTLTSTKPGAGERKTLGWLAVTPDAVIGTQAGQIRGF